VRGTNQVIHTRSGGPDRAFDVRDGRGSDDFDVWAVESDYFAGRRRAVEAALAEHLRETNTFPQTREALAAALAKSSLDLDSLRDGWGRPVYVTFSAKEDLREGVGEDRRRYDPRGGTHRDVRPATRTRQSLALRSAGPDGRVGTGDDFTLGYFTDAPPRTPPAEPAPKPPTFSGGVGVITGTVADPNGAVILRAVVKARHDYANLEFSAETNEDGVYFLRNLPAGFYTVSFESPGFRRTVITEVRVRAPSATTLDVQLDVGAMSEAVQVSADSGTYVETSVSQSSATAAGSLPATPPPFSTPRLREFFPETLVWSPELETARDGTARLNFKLADNVTTWKMSVIASTEDGRLGTAEAEIVAFQPFFVEHDPPRVLTEGDEISLPVVLRNYLRRPQAVELELKPESWFALGGAARQRAEVAAGDSARPTFDFRAVASVVDGKQRVTALGPEAGDAVEKPVTVHPDGEERTQTDGTLFNDAATLTARLPADAVRGSVRGELKVYPNLSAHVLEGVEAIMERPHGCGEQTISSTYPSVLVLGQWKRTAGGVDEPPVVARARRYAQAGYERLLGYRAEGGGFNYWGRGEADMALTAYALRFLTDARRVLPVDENLIRETREWLLRQQRGDGSWPTHHPAGGGEDRGQTALTTAYVARVLAATREFEPKPQAAPTPLGRALVYLAARADESDEPYLFASLVLAATDAGESGLAARAAARLRALSHDEGSGTYWSVETSTPFYGWGLGGSIETTALAVQALNRYCGMRDARCGLKTDEQGAAVNPSSAAQLVNRGLDFLLRRKDRYGVWYSTQATINVFDALLSTVGAGGDGAALANDAVEVFVNGRRAGELALPPPGRMSGPLALDLSAFVGAGDNRVELRRRGTGGASHPVQAHLVTTFYVPWGERASASKESAGMMNLSVSYDRTNPGVGQEVTCGVAAERAGGNGMLLAEVGLPPGADVDRASLERAVRDSDGEVSSYDVLPDRLVVYLWPRSSTTRFQFKFRPRYGLNALTAPSQLYDYYNPEARAVVAPTRFVIR
jgi:hypothetical protein